MCYMFKRLKRNIIRNENGNATIEYGILLLFIAMLVILISKISFVIKSEFTSVICNMNCEILKSHYEIYINEKGINHSDVVFSDFTKNYDNEICPDNETVIYNNGKIVCNVHNHNNQNDNESEDGDEGEVPYL